MSDIVITGVGAISPVGQTAAASFSALMEGTSGIDAVSFPLEPRFEVRIAGEIAGLDASEVLGPREAKRHGRVTQLVAVAAEEALRQSGLREAGYEPERIATIIGVGMGGIEALCDAMLAMQQRGPQRVAPFGIPALIPNMPAGVVATMANAQGPCYCTASACASSAHAIGEALRLIESGVVDAAICGGAEACVLPITIAAFARMGALSRRNDAPKRASRPFDLDRDGFVLAEGGGILVLERADAARRRDASALCKLLGYGASADAHHPTQPAHDGRGAMKAMRDALSSAGMTVDQVDYINAHGTGTRYNDVVEAAAIRRLFQGHERRVLVSSTKSMTGHMLGGAGAFESVTCVLSIINGCVPPTINLDSPDPECDLDFVPHRGRSARVRSALSNSFGFGGQNASLLFGALS